MNAGEHKERPFRFGLRVIRLSESMPESRSGRGIAARLIRRGTSVGTNPRAAAPGCPKQELVAERLDEADQPLAITAASIKTAGERETQ